MCFRKQYIELIQSKLFCLVQCPYKLYFPGTVASTLASPCTCMYMCIVYINIFGYIIVIIICRYNMQMHVYNTIFFLFFQVVHSQFIPVNYPSIIYTLKKACT